MTHARLLIVHPDPSALALLRSMLYATGGRIEEAASDREAVRLIEKGGASLVLASVDPTDPDGLELLEYVRRKHGHIPVLLLFTSPHNERAREALQRGAMGVLRFPLPATELRAAVAQALDGPEPVARTAYTTVVEARGNGSSPANGRGGHELYAGPHAAPVEHELLLGRDPALRQAIELAMAIAPTRTPVLILGERGTGRTQLARTVHLASPRREGPFVEVSCAAVKPGQLERELFGVRGANGSDRAADRTGKLVQAEGGTLFLSDVGALDPDLQFKILRLIQDHEYEPVGSTQPMRADVRVVLAATPDLPLLAAQGRFRPDLFERVSTVCLKLPALRKRGADIETLAQHFRLQFARELGKEVVGFTPEALAILREHTWAGNVRELSSAVERGVIVCRGARITPANLALTADVPASMRTRSAMPRPHLPMGIRPLKEALEEPEKQLILQALEALNWNRQETARVLDINRTTLYKKMKKYGLLVDEPACLN